MKDISIESQRLYYKRLGAEHISDDYVKWLNDPEINAFLEVGNNNNLETLKAYIEHQYKNEIYFWAIHLKESKKHIGNIKIDPIDLKLNSGEYGIMIGDKTSWGKGLAKEATLRILEYCFEILKLSRITLGVVEDNKNAVRLYKNIGFKIEEIRKNTGTYNHKLCNSLRMELKIENFE